MYGERRKSVIRKKLKPRNLTAEAPSKRSLVVRLHVVKKDVKYLTTLINNKKQADDFHINRYVVNMWHPRVSELKAVKRAKGIIPSNYWERAYDIKIEALQNNEHTLWAKDLTISKIYDNLLGL